MDEVDVRDIQSSETMGVDQACILAIVGIEYWIRKSISDKEDFAFVASGVKDRRPMLYETIMHLQKRLAAMSIILVDGGREAVQPHQPFESYSYAQKWAKEARIYRAEREAERNAERG